MCGIPCGTKSSDQLNPCVEVWFPEASGINVRFPPRSLSVNEKLKTISSPIDMFIMPDLNEMDTGEC